MTRRTFLKKLFLTLAFAAAAIFGIWKYRPGNRSSADSPAPAGPTETPVPQPSERVVSGNDKDPSGALLSFFILSDLHINSGVGYPSDHLRQALDDIVEFESKVEAIVITGDITETGSDNDYKEYKNIMTKYKLPPIYANMGNHDYYNIWLDKNGAWSKETMPNGKTDAMSRKAFMDLFGLEKPYHDATLNGYPILLLSQEAYVQEKPEVGEGAWYSDEQLAWFERKMEQAKDGKPVFVMIHQPLPPVGRDGGTHQLIRAKRFREIVKPYPNVFVFSGHGHQDFQNGRPHYVKETFHWFHNSSVGRVLNAQYQHVRKDAAQGLYVQVYADKVVLRGREFSNRTWIPEASWTIPLQQV